jgi:hypothetical protein
MDSREVEYDLWEADLEITFLEQFLLHYEYYQRTSDLKVCLVYSGSIIQLFMRLHTREIGEKTCESRFTLIPTLQ